MAKRPESITRNASVENNIEGETFSYIFRNAAQNTQQRTAAQQALHKSAHRFTVRRAAALDTKGASAAHNHM